MSESRPSPAAPFAAILEQLWQARHDGPVLVQFAGGKPQYVEVLDPQRIRCVEKPVACDHARLTRA